MLANDLTLAEFFSIFIQACLSMPVPQQVMCWRLLLKQPELFREVSIRNGILQFSVDNWEALELDALVELGKALRHAMEALRESDPKKVFKAPCSF